MNKHRKAQTYEEARSQQANVYHSIKKKTCLVIAYISYISSILYIDLPKKKKNRANGINSILLL